MTGQTSELPALAVSHQYATPIPYVFCCSCTTLQMFRHIPHTSGGSGGADVAADEVVCPRAVGSGTTNEVRGYAHVMSREDVDHDTPALIPFRHRTPSAGNELSCDADTMLPCCFPQN